MPLTKIIHKNGWVKKVIHAPVAEVLQMKVISFAEFVLLIEEDAFSLLSNSTNKKAKWIMAVWKGTGIVNPNDARQMEAIDLLHTKLIITDDMYLALTA